MSQNAVDQIREDLIKCKTCEQDKPCIDFRSDSRGPEGRRRSDCRQCESGKSVIRQRRDGYRLKKKNRAENEKYIAAEKENARKYHIRVGRWSWISRKYGVDKEWYERTLEEQGEGCGICGSSHPGRVNAIFFAVDHDHVTGAGLGYFQDDIARMESATRYLRRFL